MKKDKMLEAALAYAARGWYVLPIKPGEKVPLTKHGVKDATTDPDIIRIWYKQWPNANIAIDVGRSRMMVYDMDPGSSIKELNEALDGTLPKTALKSKTPRGGDHFFYQLQEKDVVPSSASKIAPHIDVRSDNGYVLLPPSFTEDGAYTWVSEGEAPDRTDEMVRTSYTGREKSVDHDKWIIDQDIPENIKLAILWLEDRDRCKLAIEGEGGDDMTYKTAAMMKSYGMSEAKSLELMWEHWNADCIPPWDYDELEIKVHNGHKHNTSQPGNMTPIYKKAKAKELFKPVHNIEKSEWTAGGYRWTDRTGRKLMEPPTWLLENFIPVQSYVMMYGAYGTFKSFIALDIAKSVSTGGLSSQNLWGKVKFGNVLFAVSEGRSQFGKREDVWEKEKMNAIACEGLILGDPVPKVTEENLERYIQGCLDRSPDGYDLMVIDTVGRAMQGANESAQEDAGSFSALVEVLQEELGCSVLALHHQGKANTGPRGSSVFGADADVIIHLERPQNNEYTVAMEMEKQKDGELWVEPKHLRLKEVHLSPTQKSLVPMEHTPLKKTEEKTQTMTSETLTARIDKVAYKILQARPYDALSTHKLSVAVIAAKDKEGNNIFNGVAKDTVRRVHLVRISEDSVYKCRRLYEGERPEQAGKWLWSND